MKNATFAMVLAAAALAAPRAAGAALPEGKIAVVRVTAVDGLAHVESGRTEAQAPLFSFDGTEYRVSRTALPGVEGVETLLLIDRRTDDASGVRRHSQEVRPFASTTFQVNDLEGKVLSYQVALLGGNLRLLGDGDQIVAKAGAQGPYHIWKVTSFDLVDRDAVVLD
jgi:hypothetical protein